MGYWPFPALSAQKTAIQLFQNMVDHGQPFSALQIFMQLNRPLPLPLHLWLHRVWTVRQQVARFAVLFYFYAREGVEARPNNWTGSEFSLQLYWMFVSRHKVSVGYCDRQERLMWVTFCAF